MGGGGVSSTQGRGQAWEHWGQPMGPGCPPHRGAIFQNVALDP